jgi:hypothetical protein
MIDYHYLKAKAKELKVNKDHLIVLAPQNDPFYTGTKTDIAMAEWFADLWQKFGYTKGIHLRRIHYQLVSQGDAQKSNGIAI